MSMAAEQLKKERHKATRSRLEAEFSLQLRAAGLSNGWVTEYIFHPERKWRFDFANPDKKIAIEVEGGTGINGRHNRPTGYEADAEKYNAAVALNWTLFRFTSRMVKSGRAIMFVEDYLKGMA